jgi:hypothetical protein
VIKGVHRLATPRERSYVPGAYTFNRASEQFHDRYGFPLVVPAEIFSQLFQNRCGRKHKH